MVARISEYVPVRWMRNRLKIGALPNRRVLQTDRISQLGESVRIAGPEFRFKLKIIVAAVPPHPPNLLESTIAETAGRPFVRLRQGLRAWR